MSAATLFLIFSCIAVIASMSWAVLQVFKDPRKRFRIAVPIFIGTASALALYVGVLARDKQSQELAKLKPRSVSESQRAELKKRFPKDTPPIRIVYRLMDGEGKDYSDQLASAIRDAGGTVPSIAGNSLNDLPGKVMVATVLDLTPKADRLCDALTASGVPCGGGDLAPGSVGGPPGKGEILLIVGRKG
jgi:hypothetical protein